MQAGGLRASGVAPNKHPAGNEPDPFVIDSEGDRPLEIGSGVPAQTSRDPNQPLDPIEVRVE
jgi:hypothetical protein